MTTELILRAINNRILLKEIIPDDKPKEGNRIIISSEAMGYDRMFEVLDVGEGKHTMTGDIIPHAVKRGDTVIVDTYAIREIKFKECSHPVFYCKSEDIIVQIGRA